MALGINGIVGVGIFFAPAEIASLAPGRASLAVFAVTALALAPVAVAFGTLGGRFDEDGGPVLYARDAFGETAAYFVGWLAYASAVFSTAATIVGLTRAVAPTLGVRGVLFERGAAVTLSVALALVCAAGLKVSARVWSWLTVAKLVPLVALLAAATYAFASGAPPAPSSTAAASAATTPLWARAALTATFAYQGFEIVPLVAGQARGSSRAVPAAVLGSLAFAAVLYVALQAACVASVADIANASLPIAAAGEVYGGARLRGLLRVGTSVSALGIAFGMVTMTPRYLSALARVSSLGFRLDVDSRRGTPLRALFVTMTVVVALVASGSLAQLFTLASIAVVTQYALAACALLALSFRGARGLRRRDAWPVLPTLVVSAALLTGARRAEWAVAAGTLAAGAALRWARSCSRRRPASS